MSWRLHQCGTGAGTYRGEMQTGNRSGRRGATKALWASTSQSPIQILAKPHIGFGPWESHLIVLSLEFLLRKMAVNYLCLVMCVEIIFAKHLAGRAGTQ